jgi:hypothetical protein
MPSLRKKQPRTWDPTPTPTPTHMYPVFIKDLRANPPAGPEQPSLWSLGRTGWLGDRPKWKHHGPLQQAEPGEEEGTPAPGWFSNTLMLESVK